MIATEIPWLLMRAIQRRDKNLLVLTLDAAVPPLSLLSMIVFLFLGVGLVCWLIGMGSAAFLISLSNFFGLVCAIIVCWLWVGRDVLPVKSVFLFGVSAFRKIPFYYRVLFKRSVHTWIRTDRRKL